ncbi:MAG: RNA polymerase sigma factor [Spirochaetes bacterium]|jgi:RNA polymerase sigma-70 factor (ECF subfamily)|nr:RNA polymerase sigma factor [Spirochaetota bacterium]
MTDREFQEIFSSTKRAVLAAVAKYLSGDFAHAIDDVVQETYIRAFRALDRGLLRDGEKVSSYLYAIARNESLRMNSKLMREEEKGRMMIGIAGPAPIEDDNGAPSMEEVRGAIKRLPERYSTVLELHFDGFGAGEISERLSIPGGTVKSRTSRGIKKLVRILEAEGG